MADVPTKRIIPYRAVSKVVTLPAVAGILGDALRIIEIEITRLHSHIHNGARLPVEDARLLQGYTRSLVELSKEAREQSAKDSENLANLNNDELADLMISLLLVASTPEAVEKLLVEKLVQRRAQAAQAKP